MPARALSIDREREMQSILTEFLAEQITDATNLRVGGLLRTSNGFSRENWTFDLFWEKESRRCEERLILRRDPAASVIDSDRVAEFRTLRALERTHVPAPRARWVDPDGRWFGQPAIIMDRVCGACDWYALARPKPEAIRLRLASDFLDLLVTLQDVDWRALSLGEFLTDPGPHAAAAELDRWESVLRGIELEPSVELEVGLSWLRRHAPMAQAIVPVHGDFKLGNVMLNGTTIVALLDWETLHLGDPLEDLGWITNPVRAREQQIVGKWEREQIAAAFAARTGHVVEPAELTWWNVFSCWKSATIVLTGLRAFVDRRFDRIHQEPMGFYRTMFELMESN